LCVCEQLQPPLRSLKPVDHLNKAHGADVGKHLLNNVVKDLSPNKTLQRVKRHLRRETRKPSDMSAKQCIMHICRVNTKTIPCCPPVFNNTQCLDDDESVHILLFGAAKSWQQEMDCQGFDPMPKTPAQPAQFMEGIEMSEDFNGDKKVDVVTKKGNTKKKANDEGSLDADVSKHCMLHGNNNTHGTSECKTLRVQAEKLKGDNGANQKGKGGNKSWKNKAKDLKERVGRLG